MTMQVKDLPENEADTLATRLREAREGLNLSRADVSKRTGIPAKSIEKFEFGTQEPSVSRLMDLANVYGKSIGALIGQAEMPSGDDPAPPSVSPVKVTVIPTANDDAPEDRVIAILDELDALREAGFVRSYRTASALIEAYGRKVKFLEPDTLLALADERDLYRGECPNVSGLFDLFTRDPDKAETYCGNVEERILDTALLGVDLYGVDHKALTVIAKRLSEDHEEIETPGFLGSWGPHTELVPMIRPVARAVALKGERLFDEAARRHG